jgi:hypothetical protein
LDREEGVLAVMGKLRSEPEMQRTFLIFFAKDKLWDQTKMADWFRLHPDYMTPATSTQSAVEALLKKTKEPTVKVSEAVWLIEQVLPSPMVQHSWGLGPQRMCQELRRVVMKLQAANQSHNVTASNKDELAKTKLKREKQKMTDLTGKSWMAIGETDDPHAQIQSFEAAAATTKGDPVYFSADHKVSPAAAQQECIGIAVKSAAQGAQCPVLIRGRVKVKAGGAITRGKAVYGADASKRVLVLTDQAVNEGGSANYTVFYNRKLGTALETTSAADELLFIQL